MTSLHLTKAYFWLLLFTAVVFSQSGDKKYLRMALEAQADQDYNKAVELFEKSLKHEGESPETLNNIGLCLQYISKKYINDAYKFYKMALKLSPKNEETLSYLGELYIYQGNLIKANEILKQLVKIESPEAETLQNKLDKIKGQLKLIK